MATVPALERPDHSDRYSAAPLSDSSDWLVIDWNYQEPIETHPDQAAAEARAEELNAEVRHRSGLEGGTRP